MLLEGIYLPLTTPFYPDGRVYLRKLEHNVDRYSRSPAAGMLVLGQAGEADGLTDAEAREALRSAILLAADEKVMIAGCSRESVSATLELCEAAATAGYDAVAVRGPELDQELQMERMLYFEAVADGSPLPVVLVSDGVRSLSVEAVAALAGHPNVIGLIDEGATEARVSELKAATGGWTREVTVTTIFAAVTGRMMRKVSRTGPATFVSAESLGGGSAVAVAPPVPALRTRTKRVGFPILVGSAGQMLASWQRGASGAMPRLSAAAPQVCCEVWQAFRDGDLPLAEEKQARIRAASVRAEGARGIAAVKHGCDFNGYYGGRPRLPLLALTAADKAAVERELGGLRN